MPGPQAYVAIVDPNSGVLQEYVTLVDSSGNQVLAANQTPQGRLTPTTLVPVVVTAVAAAATIFYTPYTGNIVPIWNGTRFQPTVFTELSNVLANSATGSAGPAAAVPNANYDLFVWKSGTTNLLTRGGLWSKTATVTTPVASPGLVNWASHGLLAGTPVSFSGGVLPTGIVAGTTYFVIAAGLTANVFEISATVGGVAINFTVASSGTQTGVAGNDTARSTATENDLQRVNGVLCNLNAITNGPGAGAGTYVGTIRTDSTGATVSWSYGGAAAGGTPATFNIWNMYNRVNVQATVRDTTATWSYTSNVARAANASASNRVSFIRGLNDETVDAAYTCRFLTAAAANGFAQIGMGLDSITAFNSIQATVINTLAAGESGVQVIATPLITNPPGLGFHFINALEVGDNTNATTFTGATSMALTAKMTA